MLKRPVLVLALAQAGHRAAVTNNLRDFRPLHREALRRPAWQPGHHGPGCVDAVDRDASLG